MDTGSLRHATPENTSAVATVGISTSTRNTGSLIVSIKIITLVTWLTDINVLQRNQTAGQSTFHPASFWPVLSATELLASTNSTPTETSNSDTNCLKA